MTHIFISYKREEVATARQVRQALRAEGYTVWWDEDVQGGQQWAAAIDAALLVATAVVVLWSDLSVQSDWVKHEASIARSRGVLIPATVGQCALPAALASVQAVNLVGWNGAERDPKFRDLLAAVAAVVSRRRRQRVGRFLVPATAAIVGLLVGAFGSSYLQGQIVSPPRMSTSAPRVLSSQGRSTSGSELTIARELEDLVQQGRYEDTVKLFGPLHASHVSGVGYGAYPKAAFAFDQISKPEEAVRVLDLLKARLHDDAQKGSEYLAPGRPPRGFLKSDFGKILPNVKSPTVRDRINEVVASL